MKGPAVTLRPFLFLAGLVPVIWLLYAIWSDTFHNTTIMTFDPVQKLNRELGNWALIFLMITLGIRPVSELANYSKLISYRRMFGLYAFFYAFLHFSSYVAIDLQFNWDHFLEDIVKRNFIIVGITAIILMIPLVITSNKKMIKKLGGKSWRRLHLLIYPITLLGTIHFFMMIKADFSRLIYYISIIGLLLSYRVTRAFYKHRKTNST